MAEQKAAEMELLLVEMMAAQWAAETAGRKDISTGVPQVASTAAPMALSGSWKAVN